MCDRDVDGFYCGVRLTLCCSYCCATVPTAYESFLVSKATAIEHYRCKEEDLKRLSHVEAKKLNDNDFRTHYLTAEVRHLGDIREAEAMKKRSEMEEKRRKTLMKRRQETLKRLCIAKREFTSENNKILMIFLLGDYLKQSHPHVCLAEIKTRRAAMSRVREIMRICHRAHPGAAFDFCVQYPKAGPAAFQALKDKMKRVFRIEGHRIFGHLTRSERLALWGTPLQEDVFQSEEGKSMIRRYLTASVDSAEADAIMEHPDSQRRINRGGDASDVATKLLLFWSERYCPEKRSRRLAAAFAERGRAVPLDMAQCQKYISGKVDYDPEELILLDMVHWRFHVQHDRKLYSNKVHVVEQRMTRRFYMDGFDDDHLPI